MHVSLHVNVFVKSYTRVSKSTYSTTPPLLLFHRSFFFVLVAGSGHTIIIEIKIRLLIRDSKDFKKSVLSRRTPSPLHSVSFRAWHSLNAWRIPGDGKVLIYMNAICIVQHDCYLRLIRFRKLNRCDRERHVNIWRATSFSWQRWNCSLVSVVT